MCVCLGQEMEGKGKHWTLSDVKFVLTNLKKKLQESSQEVRSMFRRMDKVPARRPTRGAAWLISHHLAVRAQDKSGDIDIEELEQCLEKFGMKVTKQVRRGRQSVSAPPDHPRE